MEQEPIVIKGNKQGLQLYIDATTSLDDILQSFAKQVALKQSFFSGARVQIRRRGCTVISEKDFDQLIETFKTKYDLVIECQDYDIYAHNTNEQEHLPTEFIMRTVRSGQVVSVEGHAIIMGDVNAGAQVLASGNICVLGVVRGVVHAGNKGNNKAFISCKGFIAPHVQIRIADIIARSPQAERKKQNLSTEIASIKDNTIIVYNTGLQA